MQYLIDIENYSSPSFYSVKIKNSLKIDEGNHSQLAQNLFRVSLSEENILTRSYDFYLNQIQCGLVNFAYINNILVGSVNLNILSNSNAEISSAWVDKKHRSKGIYSLLKKSIIAQGESLGYHVLATTKVSLSKPASSIISSFSKGIFPVSFSVLEQNDYQGYKNCCCCSSEENFIKCAQRNTKCILSKKVNNIDQIWDVLSFISSEIWSKANLDQNTRRVLLKNLSFKRHELLTYTKETEVVNKRKVNEKNLRIY
ncbi:GNAT family N-acetyltransferase [Vibrio sp. NTOU-M3]|uniref:GNAT family N-acetyltransferase n=1 Tax=Vibrio sp. NTOU-M3 TaxID=3234954 RepID=UPI00349F78FA